MKSRLNKDFWLFNRPIAHRGLFNNPSIPENSIIAYEKAIEKNYIIEMDIQMTSDGELVCFHDNSLERVCGINKDIRDCSYNDITSIKLFNTEHTIPKFKDFLKLINGRTPLLIEVKMQKYDGIEEKIIKELESYNGKFVVQSFSPIIMKNFEKLKPEFYRGMLYTCESDGYANKLTTFLFKHFLFKYYVKYDFFNVRIEDLEKKKKQIKNFPTISWTCTNEMQEKIAKKYALNVIFESPALPLKYFKD